MFTFVFDKYQNIRYVCICLVHAQIYLHESVGQVKMWSNCHCMAQSLFLFMRAKEARVAHAKTFSLNITCVYVCACVMVSCGEDIWIVPSSPSLLLLLLMYVHCTYCVQVHQNVLTHTPSLTSSSGNSSTSALTIIELFDVCALCQYLDTKHYS